jgi:hypothetical protein
MGGTISTTGVTLEFYGTDGNPDPNRPSVHFQFGSLTGQNPPQGAAGSSDWLKEVYLADDPTGVYTLMLNHPPTGYNPPLTSAASLNVLVWYAGQTQPDPAWYYAIAEGTATSVQGPDGQQHPLLLIDTLKVTNNNVTDAGSPLSTEFVTATKSAD